MDEYVRVQDADRVEDMQSGGGLWPPIGPSRKLRALGVNKTWNYERSPPLKRNLRRVFQQENLLPPPLSLSLSLSFHSRAIYSTAGLFRTSDTDSANSLSLSLFLQVRHFRRRRSLPARRNPSTSPRKGAARQVHQLRSSDYVHGAVR